MTTGLLELLPSQDTDPCGNTVTGTLACSCSITLPFTNLFHWSCKKEFISYQKNADTGAHRFKLGKQGILNMQN